MAFTKVDDEPGQDGLAPKHFRVKIGGGMFSAPVVQTQTSTSTVGHTTWRCNNCRALVVGPLGCEPPSQCGKCHSAAGR